MVDIVDAETRSRMMAGIRSKDTRPELLIRRALHRKGFRYRIHDRRLPGHPDIVFPSLRAVILVHGCFWHGHSCHLFKWPSTRIEFWKNKITRNSQKDLDTSQKLTVLGWRTLVIWECSIKGRSKIPLDETVDLISNWLKYGADNLEMKGSDNGGR